jgi:molybdopterin synthase catalytic subunit
MALTVEVKYFAAAREAVGRDSESVEVAAEGTLADLARALARRHPGLATVLPACRFAVGERFAPETARLADGAVVALIPPVSGG